MELEEQIWFKLWELGLQPGMSCYYQGIKVTKTKGFDGFNLAAKYKKRYRDKTSKEPWYILTNLDSLAAATDAYSKRMGIEPMFRILHNIPEKFHLKPLPNSHFRDFDDSCMIVRNQINSNIRRKILM